MQRQHPETGDSPSLEHRLAGSNRRGGVSRGRPAVVSVVMPIRNAEPFLAEQLAALSQQTYPGRWELVAVDNGCTDRSMEVVETWRPQLSEVRVVDASGRKNPNYARNRGAAAARGDLLAYCDADDVVDRHWLAALVKAAREADVVGGAQNADQLNSPLTRAWRPPAGAPSLVTAHGFLPYASGGNCAVWKDVAEAIGWDETFPSGSSDREFSWRAQLAGYSVAFAADAVLNVRYRSSLHAMIRQTFGYGMSDAQLYRRFRGEGMARSSMREALGAWRRLMSSVPELRSEPGRGRWLRLAARRCGRAVGSVRWRVLFL